MNAKELRAMDEAALKKELADLMQAQDYVNTYVGRQSCQQ